MFWLTQLYMGKKKKKETHRVKIAKKRYHAQNFWVSSVQVKWEEKPGKADEAVHSDLNFSFVRTYSAQRGDGQQLPRGQLLATCWHVG